MDPIPPMLERILAAKAAQRLEAKAKSWPEKVATIERLRDATRLARAAMASSRVRVIAAAAATLRLANDENGEGENNHYHLVEAPLSEISFVADEASEACETGEPMGDPAP